MVMIHIGKQNEAQPVSYKIIINYVFWEDFFSFYASFHYLQKSDVSIISVKMLFQLIEAEKYLYIIVKSIYTKWDTVEV